MPKPQPIRLASRRHLVVGLLLVLICLGLMYALPTITLLVLPLGMLGVGLIVSAYDWPEHFVRDHFGGAL